MFGFRKRGRANHVHGTTLTENPDKKPEILSQQVLMMRPEIELDLIIELLERKLNTKFEKRIRLDGYIDEPRYRLVLENYKTANSDKMVSIFGGESKNIFDLHEKFIESYWNNFKRFAGKEPPPAHSFDRRTYDDWEKTAVAGSREEFLLLAQIRGLI